MKNIIKFNLDPDCDNCKKGVAKLAKIQARHIGAYGSMQANGKRFSAIKIIPDFNSSGILTHYHIQ